VSKFEELREANKECNREFFQYREECYRFSHQFVQDFSDYIECPEDTLILYPLERETDLDKRYNIIGAGDFDDNGFFNFGISIRLTPPGHFPEDSMTIKIFLKIIDDVYYIKFAEDDNETKIKSDDQSELKNLYETIFQRLKEGLRNRFKWWLTQQNSLKSIGFSTLLHRDERQI
jgi:hypothetical protein